MYMKSYHRFRLALCISGILIFIYLIQLQLLFLLHVLHIYIFFRIKSTAQKITECIFDLQIKKKHHFVKNLHFHFFFYQKSEQNHVAIGY